MYGNFVFWRETHKPAKFLIFEVQVVFVLLLAIMHIRLWTVILAFSVMFIFYFFERKGISSSSILRYLRAYIVGRKRSARGLYNERVPVDFYFERKRYEQMKAAIKFRETAQPRVGMVEKMMISVGLKKKPKAAVNNPPSSKPVQNTLAKPPQNKSQPHPGIIAQLKKELGIGAKKQKGKT